MVEFIRKEHDIIAKNKGIIESQKLSTQRLLNILSRYASRCKVKSICRKLSKIDKTYDDKIRGQISNTNMIFSTLGSVVTNKDRKKSKRKLYEIEKKENHSDKKKKRFMIIWLN